MSVCQVRPESRGSIRLKSADPSAYPAIHPNYLATETDRQTMVDGVKIARNITRERPLSGKITAEMRPGPEAQDDAALLEWVRNSAGTIFHPTGTAAMGPVLDERLRVKGIRGLRVADCSIMPEIVSGNTNAPSIMIGEKAADLLREDRRRGA